MTEKIRSEVISRRRALSLLGMGAAALSLAVSTILTASDAEAQLPSPPAVPRSGPERRHERRVHRRERRRERRMRRRERREERRKERHERREERRDR